MFYLVPSFQLTILFWLPVFSWLIFLDSQISTDISIPYTFVSWLLLPLRLVFQFWGEIDIVQQSGDSDEGPFVNQILKMFKSCSITSLAKRSAQSFYLLFNISDRITKGCNFSFHYISLCINLDCERKNWKRNIPW